MATWQCGNVATSDDRSFRLQVVELISKLAIDIGVRLRQRRQLSDDVIDAADDVTVQLKQLQVESVTSSAHVAVIHFPAVKKVKLLKSSGCC